MDVGTMPYAHESFGPLPDAPDSLDSLRQLRASRYVGGNGVDLVDDLAHDELGAPVWVGATSSTDYPVTDGSTADATVPAGCARCPMDAFITDTRADGSFRWSRILGGAGYDRATSVVVDSTRVFIGGSTAGGITTTAGAGDRTFAGGATSDFGEQDGFVCRLDALTGATQWCSYVGGTGAGGVTDVAVRGDVYVTFNTAAGENLHTDPAYTAAFAQGLRGTAQGADAVILQLALADGHFVAATYVGGSGDEVGPGSLVADGGYLHYLGPTTSTDVPTPGGFLTTAPGGANLFLTTFAPGLGAMQYGTYLGGDGNDTTDGDALAGWDDNAEVLAIGITTTSTNLPTRRGVAQATYGGDGSAECGSGDAWLAVIRPTVSGDASLLSATYLGGSAGEYVGAVSTLLGSRALVSVAGRTTSANFPAMRGARTTWTNSGCALADGHADAFVALVDVDTGDHAASFLGGNALDRGAALSAVTVGGVTSSPDFPIVGPTSSSTGEGFVTTFGATPATNPGGDGGPNDAGGSDGPDRDVDFPSEPEENGGCCGATPAPVAPASAALAGLVMLLVRRRRPR
ncbi:MAG TPA: MYXO-CTERM sorting domain-containing protein [Kofleriaceae bacterium]|nr:MYXO-CTERM sorting domain-containing protein [Kofleriaceae bacterium]